LCSKLFSTQTDRFPNQKETYRTAQKSVLF
jgi:hypothetical protein